MPSRTALLLLTVFIAPAAAADPQPLRIVTWNCGEMFDLTRVAARRADLEAFGREVRPDVLLLQEVNSYAVVTAMAEAMGLAGASVACSNFNPRDDQEFGSFEVAVISRVPIRHAIEYDQTRDNKMSDPTQPDEIYPEAPLKLGVPKAFVLRGFLWVRLDNPDLTVVVTHLKSSYINPDGPPADPRAADLRNTVQREYMAGAIALCVTEDRTMFPQHTRLVGGDFNVGQTDVTKNGTDLLDDLTDGYDDTHALLTAGIVNGLRMRSLTAGLGETYDSDLFPNTGPIDVLYVDGPAAARFRPAAKAGKTYGSDHFPVLTLFPLAP